jgi:galactose-1-phosphate uridylyltransferase
MDRMNLDGRGTSVMASPHESHKYRPKSAGYPLKSTANTAVEADLPDYSGDDDFCSDEESAPRESARTPRMTWVEKESDMVDMGTQTVVHSGNHCLTVHVSF